MNIEEIYKKRLEEIRGNLSLLKSLSIDSAKDKNYNQISRNRVLIALYNDINPYDYEIVNFIFNEEKTLRQSNLSPIDYEIEVLYLSAYLLTKFNRIEDIWKFFDSKTTDFDSSIGFDTEYLLSFGVNNVIEYLETNSNPKAKDLIGFISDENKNPSYTENEINNWKQFKEDYFLVYKFPIKDEIDFLFQSKEYEYLKVVLPQWLEKKNSWTENQNLTSIGIGRQLKLDEFLLKSLINYNDKFKNSVRIDMHLSEIKELKAKLNINTPNNKSILNKITEIFKRN